MKLGISFLFAVACIAFASCANNKQSYISVINNARLAVYESGQSDGLPIVFLHGHSLDSRMWQAQIEYFSKNYRVIAIDLRGYGSSTEQVEGEVFTHADDVLQVADRLHIERAVYVGLSMGAFVVGDLLSMYPERCLGCVLASGGVRHSPPPSEPLDSAEIERQKATIDEWQTVGIDTMKGRWLRTLLSSAGSARGAIEPKLRTMVSDWTAWQPTHIESHCYYGQAAWQMLIERGQTNVPCLFVRGSGDGGRADRQPREMKYLTRARYEVIPDCGHMLNMEKPDEFNTLLSEFIESLYSPKK